MAQIVDLAGLPEPVANVIVETGLHLKHQYRNADKDQPTAGPPDNLPSSPGRVIGELRRVDIYEED
jgi:hypothetical protein